MDAKLQLNGGEKLETKFLSVWMLLPEKGSKIDQTFSSSSGHSHWIKIAGKVPAVWQVFSHNQYQHFMYVTGSLAL